MFFIACLLKKGRCGGQRPIIAFLYLLQLLPPAIPATESLTVPTSNQPVALQSRMLIKENKGIIVEINRMSKGKKGWEWQYVWPVGENT